MNLQLLFAIALPILGIAGGIVGWRAAGKHRDIASQANPWQDDSLDDWRKERERTADEERERRASDREARIASGQAEEEDVQTIRQQRIGG